MVVVHIVLIQVKTDANVAEIRAMCARMMELGDRCRHPQTKKPYMRSSMSGKEWSKEGMQHGITHVFLEEFENEEDRKYYLEEEPEHKSFVRDLVSLIDKVQIVDFTPGCF